MCRDRSVFTPEYRAEAVQLVLAADEPTAEVARDVGIGQSTLNDWVTKAKEQGVVADRPPDVDERAELERLREGHRVAKMERDFLSRAAAFLREPAQVKFSFIGAQATQKAFPVAFVCRMLEVSPTGFYAGAGRTPSTGPAGCCGPAAP